MAKFYSSPYVQNRVPRLFEQPIYSAVAAWCAHYKMTTTKFGAWFKKPGVLTAFMMVFERMYVIEPHFSIFNDFVSSARVNGAFFRNKVFKGKKRNVVIGQDYISARQLLCRKIHKLIKCWSRPRFNEFDFRFVFDEVETFVRFLEENDFFDRIALYVLRKRSL